MKTIALVENVDAIEVTMTITMKVKEWRELSTAVYKEAHWIDLHYRINNLVKQIDAKLYVPGESDA